VETLTVSLWQNRTYRLQVACAVISALGY